MLIKICDIKDIHTARLCGNTNVAMIGLHAIRKLKRKNIKSYRRICDELQEFYPRTFPVLVTKIKDPNKLSQILSRIHFEYVQLYILDEKSLPIIRKKLEKERSNNPFEEINYQQMLILDNLIRELTNIYTKVKLAINSHEVKFILAVPIVGLDPKYTKYIIQRTKTIADIFLLDTSVIGGTGVTADINKIRELLLETHPNKTFLAGGLNPENVQKIIQDISPLSLTGVDVQSGIASLSISGNPKDPNRVINFISRALVQDSKIIRKKAISTPLSRKCLISWAITDLCADDVDLRVFSLMQKTDIDTVHVDFSDGSIAPDFIRMPYKLIDIFSDHFPCMNYDIHLFIKKIEDQYSVIKECLQRNILLKTVYFHVLPNDILLLERINLLSDFCASLGINLGLAIQSTQFSPQSIRLFYESVLRQDKVPVLSEISLITHSKKHLLSSLSVNHDRQILRSITKLNEIFSISALVSIDRDLTLEKSRKLLKTEIVNQIIIGKDLNDKAYSLIADKTELMAISILQNYINKYRKILENAKNRATN